MHATWVSSLDVSIARSHHTRPHHRHHPLSNTDVVERPRFRVQRHGRESADGRVARGKRSHDLPIMTCSSSLFVSVISLEANVVEFIFFNHIVFDLFDRSFFRCCITFVFVLLHNLLAVPSFFFCVGLAGRHSRRYVLLTHSRPLGDPTLLFFFFPFQYQHLV